MEKLPPLSGRQVVKALPKAGFEIVGRKGVLTQTEKRKTPTKTYGNSADSSRKSPYNVVLEPIYQ
jgi:hypothetical protein